MSRLIVGRVQTDTVHAGIQFEPDTQRRAQCGPFDGVHLPQRMHHAPEVMLLDQRQLFGLEETFQQQNRRTDTSVAQLQRLLDTGHGEAVRLVRQRLGTTHRAVAVGIGLDYRQRLGAGHLTGQTVIVTQGLQIDQSTGWTHNSDF